MKKTTQEKPGIRSEPAKEIGGKTRVVSRRTTVKLTPKTTRQKEMTAPVPKLNLNKEQVEKEKKFDENGNEIPTESSTDKVPEHLSEEPKTPPPNNELEGMEVSSDEEGQEELSPSEKFWNEKINVKAHQNFNYDMIVLIGNYLNLDKNTIQFVSQEDFEEMVELVCD
jgi:hypothetical protein